MQGIGDWIVVDGRMSVGYWTNRSISNGLLLDSLPPPAVSSLYKSSSETQNGQQAASQPLPLPGRDRIAQGEGKSLFLFLEPLFIMRNSTGIQLTLQVRGTAGGTRWFTRCLFFRPLLLCCLSQSRRIRNKNKKTGLDWSWWRAGT